MNNQITPVRKLRRIFSVLAGNLIQLTGMALGYILLHLQAQPDNIRVMAMLAGYLLIYFSSHSLSHYAIGRVVGIRFTHYSLGGSSHSSAYPSIMRQIFERLPFFAVHADPASLKTASPTARALMFGAGTAGTILFSLLATFYAYSSQISGALILLIFNIFWQVGTIITESRPGGDIAKAIRVIR